MAILNYTTQIESAKTIGEIQSKLSSRGAHKISMDYDNDGNPITLTFVLKINNSNIAFALPCNYEGVLNSMKNSKKISRSACNKEQALRVAWRILKVWIDAQMAIIDSQMVEAEEVFLPYAITKHNQTLYQYIKESKNQLLLDK